MTSEAENEPNSTPKLSFLSLPNKPSEPPGMLTPPLHTLASVPFLWEEAPGRPRPYSTTTSSPKSKAATCLELPPRLLTEAKVTNIPSPTTVLDGPYVGRSVSRTLSFSFGKGSFRSPEMSLFSGHGKGESTMERRNFSSGRWPESFKGNSGLAKGNFDFSFDVLGGGFDQSDTKVKITRVRRRSSFMSFSQTRSNNMWSSIYQSFKQANPWRRRQGK